MQMYEGNNIDGWMTGDELKWLYDRASESKNVAEIGPWKGRSTHALLSGCRGTVYAIDTFLGSTSQINDVHSEALRKDILKQFMDNVSHFKNLVVLRMHSAHAAKFFKDGHFDMVFIDGDHDYNMFSKDLKAWKPKCSKLLCGHDGYETDIMRALNDLEIRYRIEANSIWRAI